MDELIAFLLACLAEDGRIPAEAWEIAKRVQAEMAVPYADRPGYQSAWKP